MGFFNALMTLFTPSPSGNNSKTIIDTVLEGADSMIYTDQEKAKMKLDLLKHYEPFKIAQRILAIFFSSVFCITFLAGLVALFLDYDIQKIIDYVHAFGMDNIVLAIVVFYFMGGTINSYKQFQNK